MKTKLLVTFTLALLLGLILTLTIAYAQGVGREEGEEETGVQPQGIGSLGLADPPPTGFSVLYMFSGVANDTTGDDQIATAVHCTNFGPNTANVEIQLFTSGSAGPPTVFSVNDSISPNETGTYSSQGTIFTEIPMNAGAIEQGSGRILATVSTLICTAQLLSPSPITPAITPTFVSELEMYKP